jgi:DNA invertase Pin-like site-specific DNA recombinase
MNSQVRGCVYARGRRLIAVALSIVASAGLAPATAGAASRQERLPSQLIQQFPLEPRGAQTTALPRTTTTTTTARGGATEKGGHSLGWVWLAAGGAAIALGSACLAVAILVTRRTHWGVARARRSAAEPARLDGESPTAVPDVVLAPQAPSHYRYRRDAWIPRPTEGGKSRSTPTGSPAIRMVGYANVNAQDESHLNGNFDSQAEVIVSECERRGLALVELVREDEPQRGNVPERPGLRYALERISAGEAKGLVVAELSGLGCALPDLGRVLEWFSRANARLVAVESSFDTEEEAGRLAARTIIDVSRWERERLMERTREGMRAARRKGPPGVADYPELRERIGRMRADGMTLQAISDRLNAEGVPTVRGGARWRPSSVQAAVGYRRPRSPESIR